MTRQTEAKKSALVSLTQDVEAARAELDRLRTKQHEVVSQPPAAGSAIGSTPQISSAPKTVAKPSTPAKVTEKAKAKATETPESDPLADAKRRFRKVDQNGDHKIDRLEFRLKKVAVLSLIDVNRDGYVTIDETLLLPDAFKRFDANGDGKISSLEFVSARTFTAMDADRDGFVTFEEYKHLLRIATQ